MSNTSHRIRKKMFVRAIIGPMGAGKTTALLRCVDIPDIETVVVKHASDDERYGKGLRTHDGRTVDAISTNKLMSPVVFCAVREALQRSIANAMSTFILCDEVQFFDPKDVSAFVKTFEKSAVQMHFAGLESDCHRQPFLATSTLVALSDDVQRMSGTRASCHRANSSSLLGSKTKLRANSASEGSRCVARAFFVSTLFASRMTLFLNFSRAEIRTGVSRSTCGTLHLDGV